MVNTATTKRFSALPIIGMVGGRSVCEIKYDENVRFFFIGRCCVNQFGCGIRHFKLFSRFANADHGHTVNGKMTASPQRIRENNMKKKGDHTERSQFSKSFCQVMKQLFRLHSMHWRSAAEICRDKFFAWIFHVNLPTSIDWWPRKRLRGSFEVVAVHLTPWSFELDTRTLLLFLHVASPYMYNNIASPPQIFWAIKIWHTRNLRHGTFHRRIFAQQIIFVSSQPAEYGEKNRN